MFVEHYQLDAIDFQTNGPQLFYGLRYHTRLLKPGDPPTFHDQVGYWLWEPAARAVTFTLAIPRGQVLLAAGVADPDATEFDLTAALGSEIYGILSNPFLDRAFRTTSFRMHVTVVDDNTWSYQEESLLEVGGDEPFRHIDANTLHRVARPCPTLWPSTSWPSAPRPRALRPTRASASETYGTKAGTCCEPSHERTGTNFRRGLARSTKRHVGP